MKTAKKWGPQSVRSLRKRLKLTQEQFAHRLGVTFVSVNRWEAGASSPKGLSVRALEQIAKAS